MSKRERKAVEKRLVRFEKGTSEHVYFDRGEILVFDENHQLHSPCEIIVQDPSIRYRIISQVALDAYSDRISALQSQSELDFKKNQSLDEENKKLKSDIVNLASLLNSDITHK